MHENEDYIRGNIMNFFFFLIIYYYQNFKQDFLVGTSKIENEKLQKSSNVDLVSVFSSVLFTIEKWKHRIC